MLARYAPFTPAVRHEVHVGQRTRSPVGAAKDHFVSIGQGQRLVRVRQVAAQARRPYLDRSIHLLPANIAKQRVGKLRGSATWTSLHIGPVLAERRWRVSLHRASFPVIV